MKLKQLLVNKMYCTSASLPNVINMLSYLLDGLLLKIPRPKKTASLVQVLVVRLDAIGDFILWYDAAQALRQLYPPVNYHITVVVNKTWSTLAQSISCFDEVIPLDERLYYQDRRYRWQQLLAIRNRGFDIAINATYSRKFLYGDFIVRVSDAPQRIGSQGDCSCMHPWLKKISDRWYTKLISATSVTLMELERNAEFIRGLGYANARIVVPQLPVARDNQADVEPYYVLVPGALKPYRRWGSHSFAEIARRMFHATSWSGVVCGAPEEELLGDEVALLADVPITNLAGVTTLTELIDIISNARLLITNETAAVHIATAVGTPCVCILGGGHYGRFMPYPDELAADDRPLPLSVIHHMDCYGCNWRCKYPVADGDPMPCIGQIMVDDVWLKVATLLPQAPKS